MRGEEGGGESWDLSLDETERPLSLTDLDLVSYGHSEDLASGDEL